MKTKPLFASLVLFALMVFGQSLSLSPKSWNIMYSPGMPSHPTAVLGGWAFDFPVVPDLSCAANVNCVGVHYVTTHVKAITGTSVQLAFHIDTTGLPVFNYALNPDNTCVTPATVRLFLEHTKDGALSEPYYRWWSNPASVQLQQGAYSLSVTLTPDQWSSVYGENGANSPTATAGFFDTLNHIDNVGLTFGGGCFFGHGVNVSDGTARFVLTGFSLP